ncbi:MAG: hypothetical protein LC659_11630, partial [Myxococcales bacterium]|nr:hypothetical protein [Myxococcales bacterium]
MYAVARALVLIIAFAASSGCAATTYREHTTPFPPSTPRAVPWTLNRELLTATNQRIVFVVELVAGHAPEHDALDRLARLAARYGERPATWSAGPLPATLDAGTTYVHVRYVGNQLDKWGLSYWRIVGGRKVYVIEINQERHRRWKWFLPERHLEAQTLIHEYGHHLGLPPWDHGYYRDYPDFSDGAHCVNPDCALSKPRARALLYGFWHVAIARHFLEDYCAQCRAAIAAAKAYWAESARRYRSS